MVPGSDPAAPPAAPPAAGGRLARLLGADARATDDRGWTANLAVFRVVCVAGVAIPATKQALRWVEHVLPGLPAEAWRPISFFTALPSSVLTDAALARGLALAQLALLWAGLLGVATRVSLGLAAVLSLHVLGLPHNQGKVTQNMHVFWFLALLAAGPSGRMLSVDALVRAVRGARAGRLEPDVASPHALPTLRWVWVLFGLIFLAPGLAKLHAALADGWATAPFQRSIANHQVLELSHYEAGRPPRGAAAFVAAPEWALVLGAWAAIAFEVLFPLAVLLRPTRLLGAAAGIAFHAATAWALRIRFAMLLPAYVVFVDLSALARGARRLLRLPRVPLPSPRGALGRATVAGLRSLDVLDVLAPPAGPPATPAPVPPAAPRGARLVLAVGATLAVLQLVVSVSRVVALRAERPGDDPETAARWSPRRWPFDAYPDFTRRRDVVAMREVSVVGGDGVERRVPPSAFPSVFGPAAKTSWLLDFVLADPEAERRARRLAPLVRAVVAEAPAEVRGGGREAVLTTVRWRTDGRAPQRLDATVEARVPLTSRPRGRRPGPRRGGGTRCARPTRRLPRAPRRP